MLYVVAASTKPKENDKVAIYAGAAGGAVFFILLVILAACLISRQKKQQQSKCKFWEFLHLKYCRNPNLNDKIVLKTRKFIFTVGKSPIRLLSIFYRIEKDVWMHKNFKLVWDNFLPAYMMTICL